MFNSLDGLFVVSLGLLKAAPSLMPLFFILERFEGYYVIMLLDIALFCVFFSYISQMGFDSLK